MRIHHLLIATLLAVAALGHQGTTHAAALDDAKAALNAQSNGNLDEAIRLYTVAIAAKQLDARMTAISYNNRGNAKLDKNLPDEAIADYNEAMKLDATYANAMYNRARAYFEKKDFGRAFADYDATIKMSPGTSRYYNERGLAWRQRGELDRAMADFDKALEINPGYYDARYNRGLVWQDRKDHAKAINEFNETLLDAPRYTIGYQARAVSKRAMGDTAGATADEARVAELGGNVAAAKITPMATPEGNLTRGMEALFTNKFPIALQYFMAGAAQNDPGCQLNLAVMHYYGQGTPKDPKQAGMWLDKSISDDRMFSIRAMKHNFDYYKDFAEKGYAAAQYVTGRAYAEFADGREPTGDMQQARAWLGKASSQGYKDASHLLAVLNAPPRTSATLSVRNETNSGPTMADKMMETLKRQRRENCEARMKGANRVCTY